MSLNSKSNALSPVCPASSARWWLIAPILLIFVIINQIDKSNISVLIADATFAADLGAAHVGGSVDHARLGFISSAFFYGYGISLMVWGFVVDRIGPRKSALIGVLGWALTSLWCGWSSTLEGMYAARFALGLAEGGMWPICNKYVGHWFARQEQGRIQAFWFNGAQIGIAIGLPIVTSLLLAGGWRTVFFACALGSAIILLPVFWFLAPDQPTKSHWVNRTERQFIEENRPAAHASHSTGLRFLATPAFWMIAVCHGCLVASFFGLSTWIPSYLTKVRGLRFTTMSLSVAAAYLIPVLLALWIGHFADKRSLSRAMVSAATSVAMAALILAGVNAPVTMIAMVLLVTSMAAPITQGAANTALLHELVNPNQIGSATGLCVGVGNILGAAGPTVVGWFITHAHGEYAGAFGSIAALNILQGLIYWRIASWERRSKPSVSNLAFSGARSSQDA